MLSKGLYVKYIEYIKCKPDCSLQYLDAILNHTFRHRGNSQQNCLFEFLFLLV